MAYKTTDEDDFMSKARDCFRIAAESENENRRLALDDLRFYQGEGQWPVNIKKQREMDGRPCLTINRLPQFVHQVSNEIRQNKPSPNVSPVDDSGDKETAEILQGIIRHIERQSKADIARSYAAFYSIVAGRGYYRVVTDYVDQMSFDQEIHIQRVKNPATVYFDPSCQQPDYSDARWAGIVEDVTEDQFKEQFPDKEFFSAEDLRSTGDNAPFWRHEKGVRIAEYFTREIQKVPVAMLADGTVMTLEDIPEGAQVIAQRTADMPVVRWYKIDGHQILEQADWPGMWIPIIPVLGEEFEIDGKTELIGMVRNAKDPQRMLNYWESAKTEAIALAPRAPYLIAEGQVENHETEWAQANLRNFPYLTYKPRAVGTELVPAPQRQVFEPPIQAITQAEAAAIDHMKATTGIYDASLGNRSNETSGIAIRRRQQEGDVANYHFVDNLTTAITHEGRILVDLIPKIYDRPGRVVRIIGEDGSEQQVPVNTPFQEKNTGMQKFYDLGAGRYDVAVNVGPSYATKRQESAESMMAFAQATPMLLPQYADLLVQNMDWPGADAIAERIRPPGVEKDGEQAIPPQVIQQMEQAKQQMAALQQENQQLTQMLQTKKLELDSKERMQLREIEARQQLAELQLAGGMQQTAEKTQADVAQTESKIDSQENIAQLNAETKMAAEAMKLEQKNQHEQQRQAFGSVPE